MNIEEGSSRRREIGKDRKIILKEERLKKEKKSRDIRNKSR